jgi:hypothetical protein
MITMPASFGCWPDPRTTFTLALNHSGGLAAAGQFPPFPTPFLSLQGHHQMNMPRHSLRVISFVLTVLGIALLSLGLFGCDPGRVILKADGSAPAMSITHQEAAQ